MDEEWKWIKGFEGQYQISNYGRVKSFKKTEGEYILSNQNATGDYLRIVLRNSVTNKTDRKDIKYTIKTEISKTILLQIWNIFIQRGTEKKRKKHIHKWLQELLIITNMRNQEKYANTLRTEYCLLHM